MPESAAPDDQQFLLRGLDHTTVRLQANPSGGIRPAPGSLDEAILAFVRTHPTTTVTAIWNNVPAAREQTYNEVRALVLGMLEEQTLAPVGFAPLEEVDGRYERVPACDVCGQSSAGHPILFYKHNTPVVRCTGCGLLYSNPRWKGEHLFGVYGDDYWEDYAERVKHTALDMAANQARWDPNLHVLEGVRQTGRILDVGCATGEFLAAAQARGWEGYGVEVAPQAAAIAEKLYGVRVHVGTLDTAPWPDGWFDAVTLWDVIEHVPSPRAYVERIARLVRPGGMFAVSTPNIRSLTYGLIGRDWWVVGPNAHIYYFAPRTLVRLLSDYGFTTHFLTTQNRPLHWRRARRGLVPLEPIPDPQVDLTAWQQWLRLRPLQRLAPYLYSATWPLVNRFLLGDSLLLFARKTGDVKRDA
jgi:2-polyprenyl-3-methyl-5-hydroxy-6-metoxy-1,4-benzoquinol methylase